MQLKTCWRYLYVLDLSIGPTWPNSQAAAADVCARVLAALEAPDAEPQLAAPPGGAEERPARLRSGRCDGSGEGSHGYHIAS